LIFRAALTVPSEALFCIQFSKSVSSHRHEERSEGPLRWLRSNSFSNYRSRLARDGSGALLVESLEKVQIAKNLYFRMARSKGMLSTENEEVRIRRGAAIYREGIVRPDFGER
jgi:hypothetical protein